MTVAEFIAILEKLPGTTPVYNSRNVPQCDMGCFSVRIDDEGDVEALYLQEALTEELVQLQTWLNIEEGP